MSVEQKYALPIDAVSDMIGMLDFEHHELHDGDLFEATRLVTGTTDDERILLVRTAAKLAHTVFRFGANVEVRCELFESPTLTASGTLLTCYNRDRSSSKTPVTTVRNTATYSLSGTLLEPHIGGSTGFKEGAGASGGSRHEWVLNASTVYMWRLTMKAASAEAIIGVEFYEKDA